jgi:RNA polymerase sigma-70 factor (ECF subfamily)
MPGDTRASGTGGRFEETIMPHLDAAYNLARWLVRNAADAQDIVQESYLRAYKSFSGYQGGDARAWLLKIVRNTSYSFLERNRTASQAEEFDEQIHTAEAAPADAEAELVRTAENRMLRAALEELPENFREILILRELEGLSYKEIAEVVDVPMGTVMSSLARGRERLRETLVRAREKEGTRGA